MALSVQSQSQPFAATQAYLVTGTVGDTVSASFDDITIAKISPASAVLTAGGVIFTATRLSTIGGACTLTFKDTTDGERIDVTVNMTGDPAVTPSPISGQIGQTISVTVSETNDPDAFASLVIDDTTVAQLTITSNAEGAAVLSIGLLANGSTFLEVDDGHGGQISAQILVGASAPTKNITLAAIEAVIGGNPVTKDATAIPLQDTSTGYNGAGSYTISLTRTTTAPPAYAVTYGKTPPESTTQINVLSAVLRSNGQVFLSDIRTQQVTVQAVNSTIMAAPNFDGSYLADGVVSPRVLDQAVLDMFGTAPSGATEPTNPHEGELFFNTTTNVFEVYEGSAWVTIAQVGASRPAMQAVLCSSDFTPGAIGADVVVVEIPPDPVTGLPATWNVVEVFFRVEAAASAGTTSVKIQRSTAAGAFVNAGYLNNSSVDIASGSFEGSINSAFTTPTINSGDKLRAEYTAIGTGAAGFSCYVLLKES